MRVSLIAPLVCLVSFVGARDKFPRFFGQYARTQMLGSCLGKEYMDSSNKMLREATEFCEKEDPETYLKDLPLEDDFVVGVNTPPSQQKFPISGGENDDGEDSDEEDELQNNILDYLGSMANLQGQMTAPSPFQGLPATFLNNILGSVLRGNLTQPVLLLPLPSLPLFGGGMLPQLPMRGSYRKQKRSLGEVMHDAEKINSIYKNIRQKSANFTCVMIKSTLFNKYLDVNIGLQMRNIEQLQVGDELKADLVGVLTDCVQFASCKPLNNQSFLPPAVQRAMTYRDCETKQMFAACVKDDFSKKQKDRFDTEALKGLASSSMMDIGDKMVAIAASSHGRS